MEKSNGLKRSDSKYAFEKSKVIYGDTIKKMKLIPSNSVDMICADLPYGKTKNPWDKIIDPKLLWEQYWRILKTNGVVFLFGQDKFTAMMMLSDPNHRYNIIWEKTQPVGHLNSGRMPMRSHEDMMIFYKKLPTYNPQKTTGHKLKTVSKSTADKSNNTNSTNYGKHSTTPYSSTERHPVSIWTCAKDKDVLHPTQKPVPLVEKAIRTYTNKGDVVLDNVAGSGTVGEACILNERDFILIEGDAKNMQIIEKRVGKILNNYGINTETIFEELTQCL